MVSRAKPPQPHGTSGLAMLDYGLENYRVARRPSRGRAVLLFLLFAKSLFLAGLHRLPLVRLGLNVILAVPKHRKHCQQRRKVCINQNFYETAAIACAAVLKGRLKMRYVRIAVNSVWILKPSLQILKIGKKPNGKFFIFVWRSSLCAYLHFKHVLRCVKTKTWAYLLVWVIQRLKRVKKAFSCGTPFTKVFKLCASTSHNKLRGVGRCLICRRLRWNWRRYKKTTSPQGRRCC